MTTETKVEAVAWYTDDHLSDRSATTWDPETAARWEAKGWKVWMLHKGSDVMALQARHEVALDALRGEVGRLKSLLEDLRPYAQHADSCGDMDAYNNASVESCGCGLDSLLDAVSDALTKE